MYLSLLPLPRTLSLCSNTLTSSTLILATSLTRSPEQKPSNNQHLCFKYFSSFTILINSSFCNIVGNFFLSFEVGNSTLLSVLLKQTIYNNLRQGIEN